MSEPTYERVKRGLDVTLVLVSLPVLVPLVAVIALAIRLEGPGPIIYAQPRTGRHGRRFRMFKFRTMVENADELKSRLAHLNVLEPPDFKIPDDPRVTRVGRVLRRTSLDELPQLINVLKGEMALVGPRPTTIDPSRYELWHGERLEVLPGLTGPWQLDGRGSTEFDERLRMDIDYVRHRSVGRDLVLLVRTIGAVVKGTGT